MRSPVIASGPALKQEIRNCKCTYEHGEPCPHSNSKFPKSIRHEIELKHQPGEKKTQRKNTEVDFFKYTLIHKIKNFQTPNPQLKETTEDTDVTFVLLSLHFTIYLFSKSHRIIWSLNMISKILK